MSAEFRVSCSEGVLQLSGRNDKTCEMSNRVHLSTADTTYPHRNTSQQGDYTIPEALPEQRHCEWRVGWEPLPPDAQNSHRQDGHIQSDGCLAISFSILFTAKMRETY